MNQLNKFKIADIKCDYCLRDAKNFAVISSKYLANQGIEHFDVYATCDIHLKKRDWWGWGSSETVKALKENNIVELFSSKAELEIFIILNS